MPLTPQDATPGGSKHSRNFARVRPPFPPRPRQSGMRYGMMGWHTGQCLRHDTFVIKPKSNR
ncbi:hypothetical protein [Azospirillum melinis]